MKCKTCGDKGLVFSVAKDDNNPETIGMLVVVCDCCGGWSADGMDCENCKAGHKVVEWKDE